MKRSWREFFRRIVSTFLIGAAGLSAWGSAVCYAINASDNASDAVYADGWQEGDNGGTGFTAWNFDGTYASTVQQRIDNGARSGAPGSSTFNEVGRAWSLFNPVVEGGGGQRDMARAGRGFAPLEVGQTLKVVIDNPSETRFFRGYFVRLSGGTDGVNGNTCYNGMGCTPGGAPKEKMRFQSFEYFSYGQWGLAFGDGPDPNTDPDFTFTGLFNADSVSPPQVGTDSGVRLEVKLTGPETFEAKMIPLDNVGATFTRAGPLANPGFSIDWIEFLHFNTQSELGSDTDFFIRSIEITDAPGDDADFDGDGDVDGQDFLVWQRGDSPNPLSAGDLALWQDQFGSGSLLATSSIPEPACVSLLVMSAGILFGRSGRRN